MNGTLVEDRLDTLMNRERGETTEMMAEDSHNGHDFTIVRTDDPAFTQETGFNYEFVAYVDGEQVITAGEVEQRGASKPWIKTLRRYAEAYIDGLEA